MGGSSEDPSTPENDPKVKVLERSNTNKHPRSSAGTTTTPKRERSKRTDTQTPEADATTSNDQPQPTANPSSASGSSARRSLQSRTYRGAATAPLEEPNNHRMRGLEPLVVKRLKKLSFVVLLLGVFLAASLSSQSPALAPGSHSKGSFRQHQEAMRYSAPVRKGLSKAATLESEEVVTLSAPAPMGRSASGEDSQHVEQSTPQLQPRIVVKNAQLDLAVTNITLAVQDYHSLISRTLGGRVWISFSEVGPYDAVLEFKVPAQELESFLETLKGTQVRRRLSGEAHQLDLELPEIRTERMTGQDFTEEYVDLQARIRSLQGSIDRFYRLLEGERGNDLQGVITIYNEIERSTSRLEVMLGRQKYLENNSAHSTLRLHLAQKSSPPPPPLDPIWIDWNPRRTVETTLRFLLSLLVTLADWVLRFLLVLPLCLVFFYFVLRPLIERLERCQFLHDSNVRVA
jgi:hypothetical protein